MKRTYEELETENARHVELVKAALDVLNAHRDAEHAVPERVYPQERLLEDAFETCGCVARFVYYTGPRPKKTYEESVAQDKLTK